MTSVKYFLRLEATVIRPLLGVLFCLSVTLTGWSQEEKRVGRHSADSSLDGGRGRGVGTLAEDIEQPYGVYHYEPQSGLYRNVTAGELAQDFVGAVLSVGSAVSNFNSYAGWARSGGNFSWTIGAGAGGGSPIGITAGLYGEYYQNDDRNRMSIVLGPVSIDNIWAGYGLIYNDVNGVRRRDSFAEDDRVGDMLWLSARASLVLGNFAFSVQPLVYWLPQTGEVGWGMPGPFAGMLVGAGLGAQSLAQVIWAKEIGRWRLTAYDLFSPQMAVYNIGQIAGFAGTPGYLGDLTPIDRIGRYALGYGASGNLQNFDPSLLSQAGNNRSWRPQYFNVAGVGAYCDHTTVVQSMYYFNRLDMWDDGFQRARTILNGGAAIRATDGTNQVYAGYEFQSANPYDQFFHTAYSGIGKDLGPNLHAYALARYIWTSGGPEDFRTYGGAIGFRQQLGVNTFQLFEAGRGVFNPGNQALGIEDYIQYTLGHQLGPRTFIQGVAGVSNRRQDFITEQDSVVKYLGATLQWFVADRTSLFASAFYQDIEIEPNQRWTSRIYNAGVTYLVSETVTGNFFYQYEDTRGTLSFTEHSLFIGVSKQF